MRRVLRIEAVVAEPRAHARVYRDHAIARHHFAQLRKDALRHHRIGSLPVVAGKQLVGIITRSDILDFVLSGAGIKVPAALKKARKKALRGKKRKS